MGNGPDDERASDVHNVQSGWAENSFQAGAVYGDVNFYPKQPESQHINDLERAASFDIAWSKRELGAPFVGRLKLEIGGWLIAYLVGSVFIGVRVADNEWVLIIWMATTLVGLFISAVEYGRISMQLKDVAVRIDGESIAIAAGETTYTFTRDAVQVASVETIWSTARRKSRISRVCGLHIREMQRVGQVSRPPAGWPTAVKAKLVHRPDEKIPVCVLGPMTDQQSGELSRALARYNG